MLVNISMEHLGMVFGESTNLQISMVSSSLSDMGQLQLESTNFVASLSGGWTTQFLAPTGSFHAK